MRNKLKKALLFFVLLVTISSCVVTTPYDRQYHRMPRPHSMLHRPRPVKANSRYSFGINPFGYSSSQRVEHWPRYHGSRENRRKYWPHTYIPHAHYYKVRYYR